MQQVTIAAGRDGARLVLGPPEGAPTNLHYTASLTGPSFSGSMEVYDLDGSALIAFFRDLAEHWRSGWEGAKLFGSLEGHLNVEATRDRSGHVGLCVVLARSLAGPAEWSLTGHLEVGSGELEAIAEAIEAVFGRLSAA